MPETLAYFLTWTTYGTWLHGNPKGSVDRHNAACGMEFHPPNRDWEQASRNRMKHPKVVLSPKARKVVERTVCQHCEYRAWELIAVNCLPTHIHLIVSADEVTPERVMTELKAYATRALRREKLIEKGKVWTRGGSTRYLHSESALNSTIRYVRFQ